VMVAAAGRNNGDVVEAGGEKNARL